MVQKGQVNTNGSKRTGRGPTLKHTRYCITIFRPCDAWFGQKKGLECCVVCRGGCEESLCRMYLGVWMGVGVVCICTCVLDRVRWKYHSLLYLTGAEPYTECFLRKVALMAQNKFISRSSYHRFWSWSLVEIRFSSSALNNASALRDPVKRLRSAEFLDLDKSTTGVRTEGFVV